MRLSPRVPHVHPQVPKVVSSSGGISDLKLLEELAKDTMIGPFAGCTEHPASGADVLKWTDAASHTYDAPLVRPAAFCEAVASALGVKRALRPAPRAALQLCGC